MKKMVITLDEDAEQIADGDPFAVFLVTADTVAYLLVLGPDQLVPDGTSPGTFIFREQ